MEYFLHIFVEFFPFPQPVRLQVANWQVENSVLRKLHKTVTLVGRMLCAPRPPGRQKMPLQCNPGGDPLFS